MVTGASGGPSAGPVIPFWSVSRAAAKGCAPKGMMSPTTAWCPSAVTYNFWFCFPCIAYGDGHFGQALSLRWLDLQNLPTHGRIMAEHLLHKGVDGFLSRS